MLSESDEMRGVLSSILLLQNCQNNNLHLCSISIGSEILPYTNEHEQERQKKPDYLRKRNYKRMGFSSPVES